MNVNKHGFEIETCGRCGGTGEYSFNLMDGTRCYGCQGKGVRYTKRGAAAYEYFRKGFTVKWSEVEVGQKVFEKSRWLTVTAITDEGNSVRVNFGPSYALYTSFAHETKVFHKMESARIAALEYQDNLTKAGKPRAIKVKTQA